MNNLRIDEVLRLLKEKNESKAPEIEERKQELSDFFCDLSYELDYLLNDADISGDQELDLIVVQHIMMNIAVSDYLLRYYDEDYCQESLLSGQHYIAGQRELLDEFKCDPPSFLHNFCYARDSVVIGPFTYREEEFKLGLNYLLIACSHHDDKMDHDITDISHLNPDNDNS